MKYKYFLFDWDGTLADSLEIWVPALRKTLVNFGIFVNEQMVGERVVANWNGPKELGVSDQEAFFVKAAEALSGKLPQVQLVPGVREVLLEIKNGGGKAAILTSSKRDWVLPAIKNLKLMELVDVFLGKEDVEKNKPDPEMIVKAMEAMGAEKESTLMVGDHQKDIEMARNAGIASVLYYPKRYERFYRREFQENLGATYMIEDYEELESVI